MFRNIVLPLLFAGAVQAQRPAPAPAQTNPVLILGATAHLGTGQVIQNSAVAFENGKITMVADATTIRLDRSRFAQVYDASGKHLYPGLIAADSRLGLVEIDAVRSTQDFNESGTFNPNARAIIAYNTDSEVIPTVRSNGVLLAQVTPTGGRLSGTSAVVHLDAWNWEDAALRTDDGVHLNWPVARPPQFDPQRRNTEDEDEGAEKPAPKDPYDEQMRELERFFQEAAAYCAAPKPLVHNARFEAMRPVLTGNQNLYLHAGAAKAIQEAVLFAERFGAKAVVVGAADAALVVDFLKAHQTPVILAKTQRLPAREDESVDQPYATPAALRSAGVLFCITEDGSWRQRNLPFEAGQAVGYGLPYEAAVSAITLHAAQILGVADRCGSIEVGKDATLFISEGDALDMRTNQVTAAFIQGRSINLDNKQKALYRNYESKY